MKIGVLSDTHIRRVGRSLPAQIYESFKDVDMILHAGDLVEIEALRDLEKIAKTTAVYGNMDDPEVRKLLREKEIIKIGAFTIGLIHGYGSAANIIDRIKNEFKEKVDAIVFGHSHAPVNETRNGILFFNPGSPTDRVFAKCNSFGILTVNGGIKGEIIRINGR